MLVVSNTSPLSNLAIIGRLELLEARYDKVIIPAAVRDELEGLSHANGKLGVERAMREGWLVVDSTTPLPAICHKLDPGESSAISLALALKAEVLLIDERKGRKAARAEGLNVGGLLGELMHARMTGCLSKLAPEIARLRSEANFFVDAEIEAFILSQAGE